MDNRSSSHSSSFDRAAIGLSGLCVAHCLLLPVVIALSPLLNGFGSGHFHLQMLLVVVPVSLFALTRGFGRHRNQATIALGLSGLAILIFGATVAHRVFGPLADTVLTIAGSLVLATAHYCNGRLVRHARNGLQSAR